MHDNAKKGEQEMAVTMQQIADLAGVSRGTVDRALNDRGRIRPEVAEKIKMIARNLDISRILRQRHYHQAIRSCGSELFCNTQIPRRSRQY